MLSVVRKYIDEEHRKNNCREENKMKNQKCPNCGKISLPYRGECSKCGYKDWSYEDLPKDKYGHPIMTKHGTTYTICSHCGDKVRNWFRWSSDADPPDDWGNLTNVRWLCKKCYKDYIRMLENFIVNKSILKELKSEGYLDGDRLE